MGTLLWCFLTSSVLLVGCATGGKAQRIVTPLTEKGPITLELKSEVGRIEKSRVSSASWIQNYEEGELRHEKGEEVDFSVSSTVKAASAEKGEITIEVKTSDKDGYINLEELAYPEVGDPLEFTLSPSAKVMKAGKYDKSSLFFIPPISLPAQPVMVGDTWVMTHDWIGEKNRLPLHLELVSVLKGLYPCADSKCADIEISGEVKILASTDPNLKLSSRLRGRMLFSIEKGSVVWSDVRSEEEFADPKNRILVRSCLVSMLVEPQNEAWDSQAKPECDPRLEDVVTIPGIQN